MRRLIRRYPATVSLLLAAAIALSVACFSRLRYSRAESLVKELKDHATGSYDDSFSYFLAIHGLKEHRDLSDVQDDLVALGEESVPVLIKTLDHEDSNVRCAAAVTLRSMGPSARIALRRLFDLATYDTSYLVRGDALAAIVSIDPKSPGVRDLLEQMAESDTSGYVREVAAGAIWCLDNHMPFAWQ